MKDFKARIAAMARGSQPNKPAYEAPQMDAATIMADLKAGVVRPAHAVRGPRPPKHSVTAKDLIEVAHMTNEQWNASELNDSVRAPDHRNGGATFVPRGGAALQIYQRKMWGDR